ncbi:MAG: hypothetical protein ACI4DK_11300 [Lachnospiraceae bacterium]
MLIVRKDRLLNNIIYLLYSVNLLLGFFAIVSIRTSNIILMVLGVLSILLCLMKYGINHMSWFFIFIIMYSFFGVLSYLWNGNADLIELLWPIGLMGIGCLIIFSNVSSRVTMIVFFFSCFSIIARIIMSGGVDYLGGSSSRNSVSVYVLLLLSIHMICAYREQVSIKAYYPIVATLTCFIAIGRSGIIMSLLLLGMFLLIDLEDGNSKFRSPKYFIAYVVGLFVVYLVIMRWMPKLINNVIFNFQWRGMRSSRITIWAEYISKIDDSLGNIICGPKIGGTTYLDFYADNLHNSFLMLHAKYGLGGVLLIFYSLIKTVIFAAKKRNMYFLIPIIAILFRMNFDYTNFNGALDTVLIVLLLYPRYSQLVDYDRYWRV